MPASPTTQSIDAIRAASRKLVRELGFMGGDFAGTDLSPSAVHAVIEIEAGRVTARELAECLCLEKSSVSRMLRKLIASGDVLEKPGEDGRTKILRLTDAGLRRLAAIHAFARQQVSDALARLEAGDERTILKGIELYATALQSLTKSTEQTTSVRIVEGFQTGLIARITQMHANHYARASGFGQPFESVVASELAEFCGRLENPRNAIWTAMRGTEIVGSIAIDGEDLGGNVAHLRWFIVDDSIRGSGSGRQLLSASLDFVDRQEFAATRLWTFSGLDAARHLYERHGFAMEEEWLGTQWGNEVLEQRFVRWPR